MKKQQDNIWVSIFQRSGQRFVCSVCGYAGEFNSFRLMYSGTDSEVVFFCPSCNNALVFDAETKSMRAGSGEMIRPEISIGGGLKWTRPKPVALASLALGVVILVLGYATFSRLQFRLDRMESSLRDPLPGPTQPVLPGGPVDLSFPGSQEIGSGYAVIPRSAVRESSGVRIRGVVVNEKSIAVDARFRMTLGGQSQTFFVENLQSGTGDTFEVFFHGLTDTSGTAMVEVVETSLKLE